MRLSRSRASVGQSDQSRGSHRFNNARESVDEGDESLERLAAPLRVGSLLLEVTLVSLKRKKKSSPTPIQPPSERFAKPKQQKNPVMAGFELRNLEIDS